MNGTEFIGFLHNSLLSSQLSMKLGLKMGPLFQNLTGWSLLSKMVCFVAFYS